MSLITSMLRIATVSAIALGSTMGYAADPYPALPSSEPPASSHPLGDSAITAKVKVALLSSKLTGISVKTDNGVVALSGVVATESVRQKVEKIASSVEGVKGVDTSALTVGAG